MHPIQEKLLGLSKKQNLATVSLRELARLIAMPDEPAQKIKHHLLQLQKKGFLSIDRGKGTMSRAGATSTITKDLAGKNSSLFSIPIIGMANCGPATIFAEENFQGFLRVSSKLVGRSKPTGLYAIRTDGSSMNRAKINERFIEDGDLVIVDGNSKVPRENDVVLAIIDGNATIKRFIDDRDNGQIVLKADSSLDYDPIYLHPEDDFQISGKVIGVIKKPKN
jgi:SOS-response transcriptional repressor LexA